MKKIIIACITLLTLITVPALAKDVEQDSVESNITITQEMLLNMDDSARNALFDGLKVKRPETVPEVLKGVIPKEALEIMSNVDVSTFKGKTLAIADTLVEFCERLGVTVNEFMGTGAGTLITVGIIYKMGVFGSIWGTLKGILVSVFLAWLMIQLNTKKVITLEKKGDDGKVISSTDELVPKFNAITSEDQDAVSVYRAVATLVCFVVMCFAFIFA